MKVNKKEKSTELSINTWVTANPVSLIFLMIDVYGSVAFPRDKRLTNKEARVMAAIILSYNEGYDKYLSNRFKNIMRDLTELKSASRISKYLVDLYSKGWLTAYDTSSKTLDILDFFKNIDQTGHDFKINIEASYEADGSDKPRTNTTA